MKRTSIRAFFLLIVGLITSFLSLTPRTVWAQSSQGLVADSTELRALRQLYLGSGGANWVHRDNWPTTPAAWAQATIAQAASWYGLQVDQGDVVDLNLDSNYLTGPVPVAVASLGGLRRFYLGSNPYQPGPLPAAYGQLTQLRSLTLNNAQLTGPLPAALGQLTLLEGLNLTGNALTGSLPAALGQCRNLQFLNLRYNQLSGPLPTELGQCQQLRALYLSSNQVSGALPPSIGQLTQLSELDLGSNQLSGPLPASFGQLRALVSCVLSQNNFNAPLPSTLGGLRNLSYFDASNSALTGPLPDSLGAYGQLQWLYLSNNQLSGPLPSAWGRYTQLHHLYLNSNALSGPLPSSWGGVVSLWDLVLSYNQLSGTLPDSLGQLQGLGSLGIDHNQFTGSLRVLPRLRSVGAINAAACHFSGELPAGLGQLAGLHILYLDGNQLSGSLPADLAQAPLWAGQLQLGSNQFSGTLPASIVRLGGRVDYNNLTDIEQLGGSEDVPVGMSFTHNYFSYAALERLYRGPGQLRLQGGADMRWQNPPSQVDTVSYAVGASLTLLPSGRPAQHPGSYQWQRQVNGQWVEMPGDTRASLVRASVAAADQGWYRRLESNLWVSDPGQLASKTLYLDVLPFQAAGRNLPDDTNTGLAYFKPHQPVDSVAAKPADMNYVRTWVPRVELTDQNPGAAAQAQASAAQAPAGSLRYEHWTNLYDAAGLESLPLTTPAASSQLLTAFQAPGGLGDYYGARLRGYLLAPATGNYDFWLSGDDQAQLWLSADENPAHARLLAALPDYTDPLQYDKFPEQHAAQVPLVAGRRYYVEVRHYQAQGGDGVALAWTRPDQPGVIPNQPIAGQFLAPASAQTPLMPLNLAVNGGFEVDGQGVLDPQGWQVRLGDSTTSRTAFFTEDARGAHSGTYYGVHYAEQPYAITSYQTLTGLAPGTYRLRAWLRSNDGNSASYLYARSYGGAERQAGLAYGTQGWVAVELDSLVVSSGQLELGIRSNAGGGQGLSFDDVSLLRLDGPAPVAAPVQLVAVPNASFEADSNYTRSPQGWTATPGTGDSANASFVESSHGAHTGTYYGVHYAEQPYEIYTSQTLTGLQPGTYTLRAWVRSNDGQSCSELRARGYGGENCQADAPYGTLDWQPITLTGLQVTTGQLELGVYTYAQGGHGFSFDDFSLEREPRAASDPDPDWTVDQATKTTQYLDGLGRPVQTVQHQASPQRRDLVQVQAYDGLGREPLAYLPFAADTAGTGSLGYHARGLTQQQRFYLPSEQLSPPSPLDQAQGVARTGAAYAETLFEASPLNRVLALGAPGEAWQLTKGHITERLERPNTAADSVLYFKPGYDPQSLDPGYRGFYQPGELWGVEVMDPHGPTELGAHGYKSIEWKDKLGQVVLKQVETARAGRNDSSRWLRTSYVYDDFSRLRFVLQPEGVRRLLAGGNASPAAASPTMGTVTREQWDDIGGGVAVTDIPLNQTPSSTGPLTSLEGPTNIGDNYGDRIRGYLKAPQTGDYTFWLAGDDECQFWLSTDSNPAHKQLQAQVSSLIRFSGYRQWDKVPEQQSGLVHLVAGQFYYLEVLHKQGYYANHVAVTWRLPDGSQYGVPIAGQYLAPYPGPVPVTTTPDLSAYLFHYRYDARGRQIAKQVPGQDGETLVVYDQLDRPVLSQDAQQRTRKEWSWSKYDALGRVVLTGLVTRQDTLGQVSLQAMAAADTTTSHQYEQRTADKATYAQGYTTRQAFPRLGGAGQQGFGEGLAFTASYFDDYDFDNNGQPDADGHYLSVADAAFPAGQAPVADEARVTGLATRTLTKVLHRPQGEPGTEWLSATLFYDERGRVIQTQSTNARGGQDVVTLQLDFLGKPVRSVARHQVLHFTEPLQVMETMKYDHAERLLATYQQLPGETKPAPLSRRAYNELGQLVVDSLASGRLAQNVKYAYNIRGWLTSLNNPYQPAPQDLFNLSLHYETGFTKGYEQYNGNLTGQTWRGRDGVQRAYGYVYDPLNRLLQGDFVARTTTANPSTGAWQRELDRYRLTGVGYDDNGNINTLRRQGLLQAATSKRAAIYGAVDNLTYAYQGNRLQAVDDQVTGNQLPQPAAYHGAPTSLAGDFQEAGVHQGQEYRYDAAGNLTADLNKGITGILYNHLNLPRQIHFGQGADSVVFRYAASGQKVAKLVYQTGKPAPVRTDYLGPYQYEQDSLKFFPHAAGRVLRFVSQDPAGQVTVRYQREYTIKDHLGNLRLAYRAGQVRRLLATLEQDSTTRKRETQQFDSLSVSTPIATNTGLTHSGQYAAKLNAGGSARQPLGPLTQLGVQKGDTVRVTAYGLYQQPVQRNFFFSLASFITNLFHPAQAPPPGLEAQKRKGFPILQVGVAAGLASIPQLGNGVPKGYLRVLFFNKDSALVRQRTWQLSQVAAGGFEQLGDTVRVSQDGYVTVYVGNESDVDVLFDDIEIEHRPGLLVQETQYDPVGLELAGLAAPSPGIRGLNNYRFNGKEFQMDLGLNWNHQDWRFLDPTILRWNGVDPELENGQETWTPYSFGFDNAVRYADANGRAPGGPGDGTWANSLGGMAVSAYKQASSYVSESNTRGQQLLQRLQAARAQAGITPTFFDKVTDAPAAYAHAYLSGGAGNYTDQNDVAVLASGQNFDGSRASNLDKGFAVAGLALPFVGGKFLSRAGGEMLYKLQGLDIDLRGTGTKFKDALSMAFEKTGKAKKEFEVTMWGKDLNGKDVPVEYRAAGGFEVSIDYGHNNKGQSPDVPHIGWQTNGKGTKQQSGHIMVEQVPAGRTDNKLDKTVR